MGLFKTFESVNQSLFQTGFFWGGEASISPNNFSFSTDI